MRVAFRVDASDQIGTGHFMRCLTLAGELQKSSTEIIFLVRVMPEHLQKLLIERNYRFVLFDNIENAAVEVDLAHSHWLYVSQEQDARDTTEALSGNSWDWLVVDHYSLDYRWESVLRKVVARILVIDDLADRKHDCNILLDQNLYADMEVRYNGKVSISCKVLLGPRYALLRDEFVKGRKNSKAKHLDKIQNILIFFGGVDAENNTCCAINALVNIGAQDLRVNVVVGMQNPYLKQIQDQCKAHHFNCHLQTTKMAELMSSADLAIGAGGISTYERLYFRLPSILKSLAANQVVPLNYMSQIGLFDLFSTQQELEDKLKHIFKHGVSLPPDCVEDGKSKVVECMFTEFTQLSEIRPYDVRRTYRWLQNQDLRSDFSMQECPSLSDHFKYWRNIVQDQQQRVYSILYFDKHIGNCGLKNIDFDTGASELWIYIADLTVRGKGVAFSALNKLLDIARNDLLGKRIYLHVARNNQIAIRLYTKTGFKPAQDLLTGRWQGRDHEMLCMGRVL